MLDQLGESVDYGDSEESTTTPIDSDNSVVDITIHDPSFKGHDADMNAMLDKIRCRECSTQVLRATSLDGLCLKCAQKKMRELEEGLIRFKLIKEPRKYCCIPGHGVLSKPIQNHKEWSGEININGIPLYPVEPLCKDCIDIVTAWLVYFLEERGFIRKGSGHNDNQFGDPYKSPITVGEREAALLRLKDFMGAASIFVLNKEDPINTLFNTLKKRKADIIYMENKKDKKEDHNDTGKTS